MNRTQVACASIAVVAMIAFVVLLVSCGLWSLYPWIALLVIGFFGRASEANSEI